MSDIDDKDLPNKEWQRRLHIIIFGAETPAGKWFDIALLCAIAISVLAVLLESVAAIAASYGSVLRVVEWVMTVIFSFEYLLRILSVRRATKYVFSFFGIIDLLAILPTYLSLLVAQTHYLAVIRAVRLLRVFRVLKLVRFLGEANELKAALIASRHKITVFLGAVFSLVLIIGSLMYVIEGPESGFTSIPKAVYWAIVTLTTVGYGDIYPQTVLGQALSSFVMVAGYGIIAVPTGIVSVELANAQTPPVKPRRKCESCSSSEHTAKARFCCHCGNPL